jgi:predicted nucleic acid-binding protein
MTKPRLYMDSCCFIDAIKFREGSALTTDRENDLWYIQNCLKAARAGEIQVITSTLTVAEVRRGQAAPTDELKRLIRSVLTSGRVVTLAEMTLNIAERARDLEWDDGINLKGADAIHVATALTVSCKEFFTTDRNKGPLKYTSQLSALGLRVITASNTALLPPDYIQMKLTDLSGSQKPRRKIVFGEDED